MNSLVERELGMMEHEVVYTTWEDPEGRTTYNVFLYTNTCSQSLLRQGVTLDSSNSNADAGGCAARQHAVIASARLIHTYYGHGFNFYIERSRV